MGEPTLIRVDFRLLHGMVVTNWVRSLKIVRIFIVDDEVCQDQFLREVFELSKPAGITLEFLKEDEAVQRWKEGDFEESSKAPSLMLIKNIYKAKKLYDAGMKFGRLLIGNSEVAKGKKHIMNVYYFDDDDARIINSMVDGGTEITLQEQPNTKSASWAKVRAKYFGNV